MWERLSALAIFLWVLALPSAVHGADYTSHYSDLDFATCEIVQENSDFGFVQMKCPGAYGYDVYVTEADLRLYLSYKREGWNTVSEVPDDGAQTDVSQLADTYEASDIGQTLPPFNTLGLKLEWRVANTDEEADPFATIVRYNYQMPDDKGGFVDGQILVVSRFRSGASCHVAYIDALANVNANLMAREVADKFFKGGTCPDARVPVLGLGGEGFRF